MRKAIIAGNWKMNKTIGEAIELVNRLKRELSGIESVDIAVAPPYTALSEIADMLTDTNIGLGAQDMYWEQGGAFTGEISPLMLKDIGVKYAIIGHSERRAYFGETNETVNKKLNAAFKAGLSPIMCVGERLEDREAKKTFEVIKDHIKGGLEGISNDAAAGIIIAYEPVWAIGTGKTATPQQAQEAHKYIRGLLAEMYGRELAEQIRIQYGGSVKPNNIKELIAEEDIDGALVGGASLKPDDFIAIVRGSTGEGT